MGRPRKRLREDTQHKDTVRLGVPYPSHGQSRDTSKELSVQHSNFTLFGDECAEFGPYPGVDDVPLDILCQEMDSQFDHDFISDPSNHTPSYNIEYAVLPI